MLQEYSPNNIVSIIWKDLKKLGYVRKYPEKLEKDYQYILPTDKKKHELKENIDFFSGEEDFTNYLKRSNILCDLPSIKVCMCVSNNFVLKFNLGIIVRKL